MTCQQILIIGSKNTTCKNSVQDGTIHQVLGIFTVMVVEKRTSSLRK